MRSANVSEIIIKRLQLTIDIIDIIDFRYQSINCYRLLSITIDFIDYRISSIGHVGKTGMPCKITFFDNVFNCRSARIP